MITCGSNVAVVVQAIQLRHRSEAGLVGAIYEVDLVGAIYEVDLVYVINKVDLVYVI